jgi:hypothetical protein
MQVRLYGNECRRLASPFKAREEPSGLPSWISLQPLLLPGQLDDTAIFNNCSGYSSVTVYSFCAVL